MEWVNFKVKEGEREKLKNDAHAHRMMNLKLSRHEVCDLLIALVATKDASNAEHWSELHDKIKSMLADFDGELDKEDAEREQTNELRRLKNKMSRI